MAALVLEASVGRATHLAGVVIIARGCRIVRGQITVLQERGGYVPERGKRTLGRLRPVVHALRVLRGTDENRVIGMGLWEMKVSIGVEKGRVR
jgi:hypothetical protein